LIYVDLGKNDYKEILEKIIQSDKMVRFAIIYDRFGSIEVKLEREGQHLLLNENDTDSLAREGINSWFTRNQLAHKIGKGQYVMAVYEKIIRLSIPMENDTTLLVSLDNLVETPKIVDSITKIIKK